MRYSSGNARLAMVAAATLALAVPALAQPGPGGPGPRGGDGDRSLGPGMMMGPGMMGGRGMGFMCSPRAAGMAEWRMDRIENAVKPNEAQKAALAELRAASAKAAETMRAACAADVPASPGERMAVMEKRLEAALAASKTVRPAFEKFYGLLDDNQKKALAAAGPRRWGWDNWKWPWSRT